MTTGKTRGRPRSGGDRKRLIGHRMKVAAEQAGYMTTVAMAEAYGTDNATVSRWWNGVATPSPDDLERYGELVGKRLWWFYLDGSDELFGVVADALRDVIRGTMAGQEPAAAYAQVTGDATEFGRSERAELAAGASALRRRLTLAVGGSWDAAPPEQQQQALDRAAEEALRSR